MIHLQLKENKRETSMCKTASFICEAFVVYGFNYQLFQIVILVRISEVLMWQESGTGKHRRVACVNEY